MIINLLENTPNQSPKVRRQSWVEINHDSQRRYNTNREVKLKT